MADFEPSEPELNEASRAVLMEALTVLGSYRDALVIVGGWVPELSYPGRGHIGSIDVDLALDARRIAVAAYDTIRDRLLKAGYRLKEPGVTNVFLRDVWSGEQTITVKLDLVMGEQGHPAGPRSHEHIHGMNVVKLRGIDLAVDHAADITLSGKLAAGGVNTVRARIASIAAFVCMKSLAMVDRHKAKDAYDIYFCLANYPGGPRALAEALRPLRELRLVEEALQAMRSGFRDEHHPGPYGAGEVAAKHGADRDFVRRDAFERAKLLLDTLGVP